MKSTFKIALLGALCAFFTLGLIACGDDGGEPDVESQASLGNLDAADQAVIAGDLLGEALAAYKNGDANTAAELVDQAYLEHFELVEGPLGEIDPELNEQIEQGTREDLRALIADGAKPGAVAKQVAALKAAIGLAVKALRKDEAGPK